MRAVSVLLGCILSVQALATTYYVSTTGNDANSGTSQALAWQTLNKVNAQIATPGFFVPGDQILFKRGNTWAGTLRLRQLQGTPAQWITFGAYGAGAAPVITGAKTFTGWTLHAGNIYRCNTVSTDSITQVFAGNAALTLARWPNSGVAIVDGAVGSGAGITDADLSAPNGQWAGATAAVRTTRYTIERRTVAASNGTQILFDAPTDNTAWNGDGWGYHLENKLNLLDAPGEWYHDRAANRLYVWLPNGADPSTAVIQGTIRSTCILVEDPAPGNVHVRIQGLTLERANLGGIFGEYSGAFLHIDQCTFRQHLLHGLELNQVNFTRITNCTVTEARVRGISIHNGEGFRVDNCQVRNIREGVGIEVWGFAPVILSDTITQCTVDSTGSNGIGVYGSLQFVERNTVGRTHLVLDDGAAIYAYKTANVTIKDNRIGPSTSSTEGIPDAYGCAGIYIDEECFGFTVQNNTIQGRDVGILLNNGTHDNVITDNTVYGCHDAQLVVQEIDFGQPSVTPYANTITGNVLFATAPEQLVVRFATYKNALPTGTFNGNRYFHPYRAEWYEATNHPGNGNSPHQRTGTLLNWQALNGQDINSKESFVSRPFHTNVSAIAANTVPNSAMNSTANWSAFPAGANDITLTSVSGELRAQFSGGSGAGSGITFSSDMPFTNGQLYRVRIDHRGATGHALRFTLRETSPYGTVAQGVLLSLSATNESSTFFVRAERSCIDGRVQVEHTRLGGTFYMDNVQCEAVSAVADDPAHQFPLLVNNTGAPLDFPLSAEHLTTDSLLVSGSITVPAWSSNVLLRVSALTGGVRVNVKALLDGPYDGGSGLMRDDLRTAGLVPAVEPYSASGYAHSGGGGDERVRDGVLAITGPNAVVDHVVVELRSALTPTTVLATRDALIQRDGDVVDMDGASPIAFVQPAGNYHIALRHRNHLGVMTAAPLALTNAPLTIDFTNSATPTFGTNARRVNGTVATLWSGNVLRDQVVKYTGAGNDRDPILVRIGGTVPTNTVFGYFSEDVNLDGSVKYTGAGNDRDPILVNIGGTVPTSTRTEQLP
jgi:parallel beta-helix repeat protein